MPAASDKIITITIDGPRDMDRIVLAETLQDLLLAMGARVEPDPDHGFLTHASQRPRLTGFAVRIVESFEQVQ